MEDAIETFLRDGMTVDWETWERIEPVCKAAADHITALRTLVADLLEWADHQSCAIDDGDECDCGYDALAAQWEELRRG